MRLASFAAASTVFFVSCLSAHALDSSITAASTLAPDALWKKVGDFCGIGNWHPAVEKCALSADGKQRTLSLKGGGTIVEALEKMDDAAHSYTYTILSGPLPVANYHSTISVSADASGSKLSWMGKYDAKGAPDADAKKVIDGIYAAGAGALTK